MGIRRGQVIRGKSTWFGGGNDSADNNRPALGTDPRLPGISLLNRGTLGGYFRVRYPNGKVAILRQTDIGPAGWTGATFDTSYSALPKVGYSEGNFPNPNISARYLGKGADAAAAYKHWLHTGEALGGSLSGGSRGTPGTAPSVQLQSGTAADSGLASLIASQLSQASKPQPAPASPLTAPALAAKAPLPGGYQQVESSGAAPVARDSGLSAALASVSSLLGPSAKINPGSPGSPASAPHPATAYKNYKGYVNPAPLGVSADFSGRVDQGKDATIARGHSVLAIGNAKITNIQTGVQGFGTVVYYKLLDGPYKGRVVFQGHAGKPLVNVGDRVHAGQAIQVSYGNEGGPGHIEIGWGSTDSTGTLARQRGHVDPNTHYSPEGQQIADLIARLPRVRRR